MFRNLGTRWTFAIAGGFFLFLLTGSPVHAADTKGSPALKTPSPAGGFATFDSLNRIILPAQTPSYVGGQTPPLEVTPGNRFMGILVSHAALWEKAQTGLAITSDQRQRLRVILEKTRGALIKSDAVDLRLVQLFEAMLVRRRVPAKEIAALNARIGEVEGKEGMQFVGALKEMQAVLTAPQIQTLKQLNDTVLPSPNVSVTSALMFTDRMLSLRWQKLVPSLPKKAREDLARRYAKARRWLWSLATEKTISDREVADILGKPFVDMQAFGEIEKTAGPLEGKFWGTFLRIVALLNPNAR